MAEVLLLPVFLYASLCAGLPTIVWALYHLRRHQQEGGTVSAFVVSLIVSDILELVLSPFLNTSLLERGPCSPCEVLFFSVIGARLCGLHFHQLVALEGILCLTYPHSSSHFFHVFLPPALSLTVWITVISCNFFSTIGYIINVIICVVPVILAFITSALTLRLSSSSAGLLRHKQRSFKVLVTAVFTLVFLYIPGPVIYGMDTYYVNHGSSWVTWVLVVMSLRLVTDPLLCVLVCRETL